MPLDFDARPTAHSRPLHEKMRLLHVAVVSGDREAIRREARAMFDLDQDQKATSGAANREKMLLSLRQAARELGVAEKTLRVAVRNGDLTAYSLGARTLRIDPSELKAWVRTRKTRTWRDRGSKA